MKNSTVGHAGAVKEITRLSEDGYMNIHLSNEVIYLYFLNLSNSYVISSLPIILLKPIHDSIIMLIVENNMQNNEMLDNLKDFPNPSFSDVKNIL